MKNKLIWGIAICAVIAAVLIFIFFSPQWGHWESKEIGSSNNADVVAQSKPVDCTESKNSEIQKEFTISLSEIKDAATYASKKREVINLINQCYTVTLKEEYETQPGQTSWQEGKFRNKVSLNSQVFDKLPLYPALNLQDYEGVALDNGFVYEYTGKFQDLLGYYVQKNIDGYRATPTPSEETLIWTDIATTKNTLSVIFNRQGEQSTLVKFNFVAPLD